MSTSSGTVTVSRRGPLRGTIRVPGDKSVSHRALMLAAIADGTSTIEGLSAGGDVARTRAIVEALGARVTEAAAEPYAVGTITVDGGDLHEAAGVLDVGNSGTGIRLLAGLLAGLPFRSVLAGDDSIALRPMDRVVDPLRMMGARIAGRDGGRFAPLEIDGGGLRGIDYTPPVASAQVKSAVLLAGLHAQGPTVVREAVPTRRHTEEMLRERGVSVVTAPAGDGSRGEVVTLTPGPVRPGRIVVPGDPSQSAFWVCAAAAVPGSELTVEGLYLAPERTGYLPVLERMGADLAVDRAAGVIRVRGAELRGTVVEPAELPDLIDEVPALAVAAALAVDGALDVRGAAELRTKESDRIESVAALVRALGGSVDTEAERLVVHGGAALRGGEADSCGDHRVAMAAAVLATAVPAGAGDVRILGWDCVATSYPGFLETLERVTDPD